MEENEKEEIKEEVKKEETKTSEAKHQTVKKRTFWAQRKHNFKGIIAEYNRVIWPTREVLVKQTITVIVTSLMVGAIISTMDIVLKLGYEALVALF